MGSPLDRLVGSKYNTYENYLNSDHWRNLKAEYRASNLPQACAVCGSKHVQMHHKTYVRLGREKITDLEPLCRTHHEEKHAQAKAWIDYPCKRCNKLIRIKAKHKGALCYDCRRKVRFDSNGRRYRRYPYRETVKQELARLG